MSLSKKLSIRAKHLWNAFSLTLDDWSLIFSFQGEVCAICKKQKKIYHTDHCHDSGAVRGILCSQCNRALGKAQDKRWGWTADCFESAARYLRSYPATEALGEPRYGFPGKIGTKRYRLWVKKHRNSVTIPIAEDRL